MGTVDVAVSFISSRPESYILGIVASFSLLYLVIRILNKSSMKMMDVIKNPVGFGLFAVFFFVFVLIFDMLFDIYQSSPTTLAFSFLCILLVLFAGHLAAENWARKRIAKSIEIFSKKKVSPETANILNRFFDAEKHGRYEERKLLCDGDDLKENSDYLKEEEPSGVMHESVELLGMQNSLGSEAVLVKVNYPKGSDYMVYWVKKIGGSLKIVDWKELWDTSF